MIQHRPRATAPTRMATATLRSSTISLQNLFADGLFKWYLVGKREGLTALFHRGRVFGVEKKNQQTQIGANNNNVGLTFISMSDSAVVARGRRRSKSLVIRQTFEEVAVFLHELKRIAFDVFCLVSVVVAMCRLLIYEFR
jgi:hypothetical protein